MIPVLLPPVVEPLPLPLPPIYWCSWCNRIISDGDPSQPISHGIHPACSHLFDQEVA